MKKIDKFGWIFIILTSLFEIIIFYYDLLEIKNETDILLKLFGIVLVTFYSLLSSLIVVGAIGILLLIFDYIKNILNKF